MRSEDFLLRQKPQERQAQAVPQLRGSLPKLGGKGCHAGPAAQESGDFRVVSYVPETFSLWLTCYTDP
jgi:hypothetical protein